MAIVDAIYYTKKRRAETWLGLEFLTNSSPDFEAVSSDASSVWTVHFLVVVFGFLLSEGKKDLCNDTNVAS
jgi:hypothetical protein